MVHLYGIGVSAGTPRPISEAIGVAHPDMDEDTAQWIADPARQEAVKLLQEDGFREFVVSEQGVTDLARQAVQASLADSGVDPQSIDAVIFITESFWDATGPQADGGYRHLDQRNQFLKLLSDFGLSRAFPFGNWMSACANFGSSLMLARGLLRDGPYQRIMLVAGDRTPNSEPRLMQNGASVYSDVASSCILGAEPRGYRVEQAVSVAAPRVANVDWLDKKAVSQAVFESLKALKQLGRMFTNASGRQLGEFDSVIGGHFHKLSIHLILEALGIPAERVRRDARSLYGHAYASDNLLTLLEIERKEGVTPGRELLLLNTGIWAWSLILLTRTESH